MKEILRKERGITLVALIITIIVLIILAAVSINAVLKTDFIGLATNGTINYAEAQVTEQKQMEDLNDKLDNVISKIEKVSSVETYTGYALGVLRNFEGLCIRFRSDECAEFLKNKINEMTDEELFMAVYLNEYNGTFEQFIEEEYNNGNIKEKYATLKELCIKSSFIQEGGVTEAEAEAEIANMRQECLNEIDASKEDIQIVTSTGETLEWYVSYDIPMEVKDYIFQIRFGILSYKIKVSIKPYEIVTGLNNLYALDVKNKRCLTIESAKVNIDGKETSVGSEYLGEEDSKNYLELRKVSKDYYNGILNSQWKMCWISLNCKEGIIEKYTLVGIAK